MAIYDRERYKVALPQLEGRTASLEEKLNDIEKIPQVIFDTVISEAFSLPADGVYYTTITCDMPQIKGYTPYITGAYPRGAAEATGYGYCNIYNVGTTESGQATCGVRYLGSSSASNVQVRFRLIYVKD